ncbi:hypothetical protein TNCV_1145261 [Trichonephila clavipes]|nr:hypothetical protein TNCV_1145261 [Trichonephila clavipes]
MALMDWAAEWNEVVFTDESRIYLSATPRWSDSSLETPWKEDAEQLRYAPPHWSCTEYHDYTRAATPDQLWQRVEAAWSAVPEEHIQSLFELMPRHVAAVIFNNGGNSAY